MEVFWARSGKKNAGKVSFLVRRSLGIVKVWRRWSREPSGTDVKRAASPHDKEISGMLHLTSARVT